MKSFIYNLYNGAVKLKIIFCLAVLALYMALTVYGGGSRAELVLMPVVLMVYVYMPGRFWTNVLQGDKLFVGMKSGLDILLGTGFFCAVYCVAMRLQAKMLLSVVPVVFAVCCVVSEYRKNGIPRNLKTKITPEKWLLLLLFFSLLFLYTCTSVIKNALPANVGNTLLNHDVLWNVGNAQAFTLRFIPEDIRYSGVQLHYHYLTELFAGALSIVSGISAYRLIAFYLQPWVLAAVVVCLYNFGNIYYKNTKKTLIFIFSMFLLGCASLTGCFFDGLSDFFNDTAYHIITNINSQATAIIFLCIFAGMFIQLMDKSFDVNFMQAVLWLAAFFMLCFAKGPVAAIAAVGGCITLVWLFVQRKVKAKALVCMALMGAVFLVIYTVFFASGANTSMAFSLWGTINKTMFHDIMYQVEISAPEFVWYAFNIGCILVFTLLMAPWQVFMYGVGLVKDVKNLLYLDGRRLWTNSMAAGGLLAFYLFNHYAMSQVYFAFLALFVINLLAVDAIELVQGKAVKTVAVAMAALGFATTVFMYTNFVGSGARFLARNLGIIEKYPYATTVTAADQEAMEFFRENSRENALFATNRTDSTLGRNDGISNIYSAFSGRQGYMEGWAYSLTNGGVPYYVIDQRQVINEKIFASDTSAEELKFICESTGITHLIISRQFGRPTRRIEEVFEKIFDNGGVQIYATGARPLSPHPLYQPELDMYGEGLKDEG